MAPMLAMLGTSEMLIIALAALPMALLVICGMVVGIIILVRRSGSIDRRLQAVEKTVAQLRDR